MRRLSFIPSWTSKRCAEAQKTLYSVWVLRLVKIVKKCSLG